MQRILIVEDDESLTRGIRLALRDPEVEITLCSTLAKAAEIFRQTFFHPLILTSTRQTVAGWIDSGKYNGSAGHLSLR